MKTAYEIIARAKIITIAWLCVFSPTLMAAELQSLNWDGEASAPTLLISLNGTPNYETDSLDDGRRLRIRFIETTLADAAVDIAGKGVVKGVFPYLADNEDSVHVDILLKDAGTLAIENADGGLRVTPLPTVEEPTTAAMEAAPQPLPHEPLVAAAEAPVSASEPLLAANDAPATTGAPAEAAGSNVLESITFSALPGGRVQINIRTQNRPAEPGSFITNKPARLAFDFFGMRNGMEQNVVKIGAGAVDSVAAVETDDRTRIVFNLVQPVTYESEITDDGLTLVVESIATAAGPVAPKTTHFAEASGAPAEHSIDRVDFRRGPDGGGRIIVDLSDPEVGIDIREETGEIIIDFLNSQLPTELEQRLDVVDFATPVQSIDTFQQGDNVRMVIVPSGKYEHLAYQTGNVFTVNVNPVVEDEEQKKADEFGYTGEKLSLNFQKISVRAALQVIADFTGLNFVTSDSVKGTLTLRLKDVPWDQALDIILQTRGLGMRQKGNVVWVAPASEIAARERAELEASKQVSELEPLVSELIQVNYAKAADIAKLLKSIKAVDTGVQQSLFGSVSIAQVETDANSLLSPRGNVTVDERTNTILIQDTAGKIREVRKLIAKLDKPVRQVLIETRIVEATDDFSRVLGARLGFSRVTTDARFPGIDDSNIGDTFISGTIEDTTSIRETGTTDATGGGLNVDLATPGIGNDNAASYAIKIAKAGLGFAHIIDLEISALEAEGRGKVIANPRLITANQKEAHIEQGQERIFTTSVLGVGSVVTKKAVLGLTVTPQITPDDRIVMDVFITQDSFVSPTDPTINTKQINTQVLLDNGETVVIGGIYQQDKSTDVTKVPVLGDIPVLGTLFRKTAKQDNRTELLIFLTPRIISPALNIG